MEQVGQAILAMGPRKGDRMVLIGENTFFWVSTYLGILRAGLVCVPLPDGISSSHLQYIVRTTDAHAILIERETTALKCECPYCDRL